MRLSSLLSTLINDVRSTVSQLNDPSPSQTKRREGEDDDKYVMVLIGRGQELSNAPPIDNVRLIFYRKTESDKGRFPSKRKKGAPTGAIRLSEVCDKTPLIQRSRTSFMS